MARQMKDSGIEWIGEIPETWELGRIGQLYSERREKVSDRDYAPLSVTMQGIVPQLSTAAKTDAHDDRKLVKKGDFAINSRSDRRGSCGVSPYDGSVSLINTILTPHDDMNAGYYNWLFHTTMFADEYYKWGHGIVNDLWTTGWQDMKRISIPVPCIEEQEKIADYLDQQCAYIDAVIEKTKASIEEYKKLKQAVITQAVTKGVRGDRPMKDSGIEMIGEIPNEWEYLQVSRIATLVRGGSPRPAGDERYFNGDFIPWITVAEVTNSIGKYIESTETYLTEEGSKRSRIIEEDTLLLSNSGATLGVPKISKIRGCINDGSVAFLNLKIEKEYLLYVFESYTDELRKQRQGYGQPNLNTEIIKSLYVPYPSKEEQQEIINYLDKKCVEVDVLVAKKESFLAEMESYKKSLIYEYVTGKKEVPQSCQ